MNQDNQSSEQPKRQIGTEVPVYFRRFNKTVEAKVDTGATMSCLGATEIVASGGKVTFNSEIFEGEITLPITEIVKISSADGGTTDRFVVEFDIRVADAVSMDGVKFNLTDRTHMDSQVLLGQNVLAEGGFAIVVEPQQTNETVATEDQPDTTIQLPLTLESLAEFFEESDIPLLEFAKLVIANESIHDVDLSLRDILKYYKSKVICGQYD